MSITTQYMYLNGKWWASDIWVADIAEDRAARISVMADALAAEVDELTLMNNAFAAELESYTAVDAWEMVHRMQLREHGYRAALHWCLAALEEQATSGSERRRAVQAARKVLKEG